MKPSYGEPGDYLVWDAENGGEEESDAVTIDAYDAQAAAEQWAEDSDGLCDGVTMWDLRVKEVRSGRIWDVHVCVEMEPSFRAGKTFECVPTQAAAD